MRIMNICVFRWRINLQPFSLGDDAVAFQRGESSHRICMKISAKMTAVL